MVPRRVAGAGGLPEPPRSHPGGFPSLPGSFLEDVGSECHAEGTREAGDRVNLGPALRSPGLYCARWGQERSAEMFFAHFPGAFAAAGGLTPGRSLEEMPPREGGLGWLFPGPRPTQQGFGPLVAKTAQWPCRQRCRWPSQQRGAGARRRRLPDLGRRRGAGPRLGVSVAGPGGPSPQQAGRHGVRPQSLASRSVSLPRRPPRFPPSLCPARPHPLPTTVPAFTQSCSTSAGSGRLENTCRNEGASCPPRAPSSCVSGGAFPSPSPTLP